MIISKPRRGAKREAQPAGPAAVPEEDELEREFYAGTEEEQPQKKTSGAGRIILRILLIVLTIACAAVMMIYAILQKPWLIALLIALIIGYVACIVAIGTSGRKKK